MAGPKAGDGAAPTPGWRRHRHLGARGREPWKKWRGEVRLGKKNESHVFIREEIRKKERRKPGKSQHLPWIRHMPGI